MKRQNRKFEKFDAFELFSAYTSKYSINIQDKDSLKIFLKEIRKSIEGSQKTPITIHGKRIEMLFAYVAGALGSVKLVKQEDAGNLFTANSEIEMPDYRIILNDNEQILVEVKSFNNQDLHKKFELQKKYFNKLKNYADVMNVKLYISVYFRLFNHWVLLPIEAFNDEDTKYTIDFTQAMARSEMYKIGDCMLATTPDIEIRILTDEENAHQLPSDNSNKVLFLPKKTEIFCNGKMLNTELESQLAFYFMRYSSWRESVHDLIIKNNKVYGVRFVYTSEKHDGQLFANLGWRSSMISEFFKTLTIKDDKVIATESFLNPSEFSVQIPDDYAENYNDLPLWIFIQEPNYEPLKKVKI
ncbi:hypothetical protein F909_02564 [Acinetobacter sp. ANC 3929]|uniref:hypothetical protein n=1 Tax=unclassified Acinetobacter TaxID=196816 RepID=UPI0002CDAA8D|nr:MULTISPECIES: hypothetical protein [unclassified Acinetobacter]ENW81273.1 hypothetical protein F909_02564 [Acinetobacter sp. ANC 3929]MCH7353912.1 hypothetical protein [Acinetobacter sp. NIPH 2023]MCH7356526.1 hypothetical protein [Acinetobacter sp. NIPH 1958]MCH7361247.1 hypothetical protein [Acinetobacter sp. NIPH 2024]